MNNRSKLQYQVYFNNHQPFYIDRLMKFKQEVSIITNNTNLLQLQYNY